jgi:hypothetical protein
VTKIDVRKLATEIAEELGSEWAVNDHGVSNDGPLPADIDYAYITRADGKASLHVRQPYGVDRVEVKGDYFSFKNIYPRLGQPDHLTADPARGGEAIAKDITRKILDNVIKNLAETLDKIHKDADDEYAVYAAANRFKRIIPELRVGQFARTYSRHLYTDHGAPIYADIEIDRDPQNVDRLTLKNLEADEVSELLQVLKDIRSSKASRA